METAKAVSLIPRATSGGYRSDYQPVHTTSEPNQLSPFYVADRRGKCNLAIAMVEREPSGSFLRAAGAAIKMGGGWAAGDVNLIQRRTSFTPFTSTECPQSIALAFRAGRFPVYRCYGRVGANAGLRSTRQG